MRTLQIQLSDPAFATIAGVAQAYGQTVEAFVAEAAQRRAEDNAPIRLTPEQIAICEQAEADIDAGRFFTAEQVRERFVAHRTA